MFKTGLCSRVLAPCALFILLAAATQTNPALAHEDPDNPPPAKPDDEPAAPSKEDEPPSKEHERAALKAELKKEILAEIAAERKAARHKAYLARLDLEKKTAAAKREAAEANKKAEEAKRLAEEAKKNLLQPPGQAQNLADHDIANSKNRYRPGTGMHLESEDGAFALATRLRAQLRHQIDFGAGEPPTHVFQIRRARVQFKGHTFGKHNKFKVELAVSPRDLSMTDGVPHRTPLLTWYMEFDHLRDLTLRAGQYKIPYSRQRVVSSGDLQLVDRAIANGEFNHDRDIGFDIRSKDVGGLGGYLRYYAGVYMGEGRDFGDKNATPDFKLHYLARVEVQPFGKFKDDYKEADMKRHLTPKLSLGAAYAFHHQSQGLRGVLGSTASDEGTTDYHSANVDYAFKYAGFSSTGEFHWRDGTRNPGDATIEDPSNPGMTLPAPVEAARNGVGWFVQVGYLVPRVPFEVAARYSGIRGIGEADSGDLSDATGFTSLSQRDSFGVGMSYYFASHPLKLQMDYFRGWSDGEFADGDNQVRTQLQLAL